MQEEQLTNEPKYTASLPLLAVDKGTEAATIKAVDDAMAAMRKQKEMDGDTVTKPLMNKYHHVGTTISLTLAKSLLANRTANRTTAATEESRHSRILTSPSAKLSLPPKSKSGSNSKTKPRSAGSEGAKMRRCFSLGSGDNQVPELAPYDWKAHKPSTKSSNEDANQGTELLSSSSCHSRRKLRAARSSRRLQEDPTALPTGSNSSRRSATTRSSRTTKRRSEKYDTDDKETKSRSNSSKRSKSKTRRGCKKGKSVELNSKSSATSTRRSSSFNSAKSPSKAKKIRDLSRRASTIPGPQSNNRRILGRMASVSALDTSFDTSEPPSKNATAKRSKNSLRRPASMTNMGTPSPSNCSRRPGRQSSLCIGSCNEDCFSQASLSSMSGSRRSVSNSSRRLGRRSSLRNDPCPQDGSLDQSSSSMSRSRRSVSNSSRRLGRRSSLRNDPCPQDGSMDQSSSSMSGSRRSASNPSRRLARQSSLRIDPCKEGSSPQPPMDHSSSSEGGSRRSRRWRSTSTTGTGRRHMRRGLNNSVKNFQMEQALEREPILMPRDLDFEDPEFDWTALEQHSKHGMPQREDQANGPVSISSFMNEPCVVNSIPVENYFNCDLFRGMDNSCPDFSLLGFSGQPERGNSFVLARSTMDISGGSGSLRRSRRSLPNSNARWRASSNPSDQRQVLGSSLSWNENSNTIPMTHTFLGLNNNASDGCNSIFDDMKRDVFS